MRARALGWVAIPMLVASAAVGSSLGLERTPVRTPFVSARSLFAPGPREGFHFAILGDRTGGPEEGIEVLARAVEELNGLDPDFVMTVGDLINGYNREDEWLAQMQEFRATMEELRMPWYPVAGNHDVYGEDGDPFDRGNESRYLDHFGPLYYSFDHEFAHFIVLYSDEYLSYDNPAIDQQMSREQLAWLREDLASTTRDQAFVFLHHPRWNYEGGAWDPVHEVLAQSGIVRAVFAGHWHRYRFDGERDGILYYLMAATGAHIGSLREAGQLHHYNLVSVRPESWSMGVIPVGAVLDQDFVTGLESDEALLLAEGGWLHVVSTLPAAVAEVRQGELRLRLDNPTSRRVTYVVHCPADLSEFEFDPARQEVQVGAGSSAEVAARVTSRPPPGGRVLGVPEIRAEALYDLEAGGRQVLELSARPELDYPPLPEGWGLETASPAVDRALTLEGRTAFLKLDAVAALEPEGPFTLECWVRLASLDGRTGLINKTEMSGYGLFASAASGEGPSFHVFLQNQGYAAAQAGADSLPVGRWFHIAGVFDGAQTRLYLDGGLVAAAQHEGTLGGNGLPLLVGADVGRGGQPNSFLHGQIDEVRLSSIARYEDGFEPARRHRSDEHTVLLLHCDELFGNLTPDSSGRGLHGELLGGALLETPQPDLVEQPDE